jgi:ATP-dependent Clp protease adapter protein ClpS
VPEPGTSPFTQPDSQHQTVTESGWKMVLLNDDVTPFDMVVVALQRVCGLSEEVAEMIAIEAHTEGSAIAKRGMSQEDAEAGCARLRALTCIPRRCPGVGCQAERDD